jgi:hypothetical protein
LLQSDKSESAENKEEVAAPGLGDSVRLNATDRPEAEVADVASETGNADESGSTLEKPDDAFDNESATTPSTAAETTSARELAVDITADAGDDDSAKLPPQPESRCQHLKAFSS